MKAKDVIITISGDCIQNSKFNKDDLAEWLLKEPDLDVLIFDGDKLVDMNTFTIRDKGNENLFDRNGFILYNR